MSSETNTTRKNAITTANGRVILSVREFIQYLVMIIAVLTTFFTLNNRVDNNETRSKKTETEFAESEKERAVTSSDLKVLNTKLDFILDDVKEIKDLLDPNR